ncbi:MAG TPA: hypothetical protein VHT03_04435 [Rhizomicrobium sp.]|jgi:hypothetical protein|nr:hypothetical protein [Rhizomicrobium sp.]
MKIKSHLTLGVSFAAVAAMLSAATGASAHLIYRPYHRGAKPPAPIMMPIGHVAPYVAPANSTSGTWTDVANEPFTGEGGWGPLLLTDGSVIVKHAFTGTTATWYKLTPNKKGKYTSGKWTQIASMPSGYQPDFYAAQVLTNGNVLIEGGEYNGGSAVWTNKGAIYDPVKNAWTTVTAPSGWSSIGDSESIILPDGTYFLGDCCFFGTGKDITATISGTTVTWGTSQNTWSCGSGPCMDEEGFTPLPNGDLILVDVWNHTTTSDKYWIYDTKAGTWSDAGNTADYLSTTSAYELGAAALTPLGPKGGTIVQLTANLNPGASDVYSVANGTWSSGPVVKVSGTTYDYEDAPAATLPDGNILTPAAPGDGGNGAHFFEYTVGKTGTVTATQVSDPSTLSSCTNFTSNLLPLPDGGVFWDDSQCSTEIAVYKPKGHAKASWLPVVSSVNSTLSVGSTGNAIAGSNFNGFDLGGAYGDDAQAATNYPIVRITNTATGDVCYARSYNFSTMGVWTKGTTNAEFDIPKGCETGASTLQVIVNGIASAGTAVTLS